MMNSEKLPAAGCKTADRSLLSISRWLPVDYSLLLGTLLISSLSLYGQQVRMEINALPSYHASGSAVYLAGSFNGWNPQDEKYKFRQDRQGHYYLDLSLATGQYEYKLTRGGWDKAECNANGAGRSNRLLKMPSTDTVIFIAVEEWADRFPAAPKKNTATAQVHIMDTAFLAPQLKRTRKVCIYLPKGYAASSSTHYPVLYMHDGQNVFDDATAYAGEWGVDEWLDSATQQPCIVVAIDNGGTKRMTEYNPYDNEQFGRAEGNAYIDFLVKTLKPYIDGHYRTLKDKEHTFIAGSSMGGLISFYALLKYPRIFGAAGVFSPSFWIAGSKIYGDIRKKGKSVRSRIYFYAGKQESENMVGDMLKVYQDMSKVSASVMTTVVNEEGRHNETTWRKEFPLFYKWLAEGIKH